MKRTLPALCLALGSSLCVKAQLYIDNATFFIESGATVTVQGDITSNASIQGTGKILLKGTSLQSINMNNGGSATNAYTIPNLEIDNSANASLTGNIRVGSSLLFTNGKIQAGNYNFVLANAATATGMADNKFIETNGTGFVQKEIGNAAASNVLLPTGSGSTYTPVSLTHNGGTYSNALLGAQAKAGKSPNAHIRTESYTNVYWPVATTGVTGGTFSATATYAADAAPGFTGTESDLRGMSYDGSVWSLTGGSQDNTANTIAAQLAGNSGQIVGMNRFLLLNTKAFLQGAYNTATGLMNDLLRSTDVAQTPGVASTNNLIPTTDPYRNATYSTFFPHLVNSVAETVSSSVFNHQANPNDNIVDWVFLELRNGTPSGASIKQTRSALIQRDGDIVDIDGVSPVYFKNEDAGNFTITIRHRNHLAVSTNNANNYFKTLGLAPSAVLDFTAAATDILGTSGTNYTTSPSGAKMLFAGNAYLNNTSNYLGLNTDRGELLVIMGNPSNAPTPVRNITSTADYLTYGRGDLNMDRKVDYLGLSPDRSFLLSNVLGGTPSPIPAKTQVVPN